VARQALATPRVLEEDEEGAPEVDRGRHDEHDLLPRGNSPPGPTPFARPGADPAADLTVPFVPRPNHV
jgi:hypothetical protein